jgi:hypothetical protein
MQKNSTRSVKRHFQEVVLLEILELGTGAQEFDAPAANLCALPTAAAMVRKTSARPFINVPMEA